LTLENPGKIWEMYAVQPSLHELMRLGYAGGMKYSDLTMEQAKVIDTALFGPLNYLFRLKTRMEKAGFEMDDPLLAKVLAAYKAVHHLRIEVHYLASSGAGKPSRPPDAVADNGSPSPSSRSPSAGKNEKNG
jgi:hypothetical protein